MQEIKCIKKNEIGAFDQKVDIFGYEATEPQYKQDYDLFILLHHI